MTDQQALELLDHLTGDDFCVELDTKLGLHPEMLTETEKAAAEKLGLLYRIAHSMNQSTLCHAWHDIWRKETEELHALVTHELSKPG